MNKLLTLVLYSGMLTLLTLLLASLIRAKGWTMQGMLIAFGNRDNLPETTPLAGRAERTARNTMEGFLLFVAVALVAQASGVQSPRIVQGAELFFWSRVLYVPVYYAGIVYLRTAVWGAGIFGLGMIVSALI